MKPLAGLEAGQRASDKLNAGTGKISRYQAVDSLLQFLAKL
mgnify:CR=1 FL=1